MTGRPKHFEIKLLTASKEVGLRRLRSYAAALGGNAQIFHVYEEMKKVIEANANEARTDIVLTDSTIDLPNSALHELDRFARVFVLAPTEQAALHEVPPDVFGLESYFGCSLNTFLESPLIRMCMAQLSRREHTFRLDQLLRWGHAACHWPSEAPLNLAEQALQFIRNLKLTGDGRRLTEMFCHFLQTRLPLLGLRQEQVIFGADGLLTTVIARCQMANENEFVTLLEELNVLELPITIVNRLDGNQLEIAALHYPINHQNLGHERVFMAFNRRSFSTEMIANPFNKAG